MTTALRLALVLALWAAPGMARAAQDDGPVPAVLDLTVNTVRSGEILVLLAGSEVWADVEALARAGLVHLTGERRRVGDRMYVRLSSLVPVPTVTLDVEALSLGITADPSLFRASVLRFDAGPPPDIVYRRAPSAFLNYGATWSTSGSRAFNLESGVTIGRAFATSSFYLPSGAPAARGMTAVIIDDRDKLRRYQVGDAVASSGPLGGAIQLAGVSVSRDFSLDPYFIRYPTTGLSGMVTTPSRVDVYVNNQLVRSLQVQPGAYELARLSLPAGAADTRVVVRDAFGGEQEFGGSYYVTTSILARGLQQYQYAAGVERRRAFDSLWSYGRPVFTAFHRLGVTDALTLGGRAELEDGLVNGGATATARAGRFGAVELSAAVSHAGAAGAAGGAAYEYVGRGGGVSLAWRRATAHYDTLTTRRSQSAAVNELLASTSARVSRRMTAGASWQSQSSRAGEELRRGALTTAYAVARHVSLFLSVSRARSEGRWSTGAYASLGIGLGERATASVSAVQDGGETRGAIDVHQSAPLGPGFGFRGQVAGLGAGPTLVDGELRGQTRWAQADIRQSVVDGRRETWAQVNGALVGIGGRVLASRPIQDGFALVRVPGVSGVRAFLSHQEMGRTDGRGDLLVPNLLPYYGNRLSIADTDVPIDRMVTARDVTLAPPYRGGAIAEFPAPRQLRLSGRVVAAPGAPPLEGQRALEARVRVTGPSDSETWLGTGGEFYLEGLEPGEYAIEVTSGATRCRGSLHAPRSESPVVRVGDVLCTPVP